MLSVAGKDALNGTVQTRHFLTDPADADVEYVHNNADDIRTHLSDAVQQHTSSRWYATIDIQFYRTTADGLCHQTIARFRTSPDILSDTFMFDPQSVARGFTSSIENFNKYASCPDWRISPHADRRHHSCKRYFWQCIFKYKIQNTLSTILRE